MTPEGDGYVTVSEGEHQPVDLITARPPEPGADADVATSTTTSRTVPS